MLSRLTIEIDFKQALSCASSLERYAAEVERIADNQIEDSISNVRVSWTGENSNLFVKKQMTLQGDVKKAAQDLKKIAADIRSAAETVYNTEMRNLEIAERREAAAAAARAAESSRIATNSGSQNSSVRDTSWASNGINNNQINPALQSILDILNKRKINK